MAGQDWLAFSTNVYVLQDVAQKWADTLKATYSSGIFDAVGEHIIGTVDKIKKSIPALKYCRGEPFKEDHWTELLQGKLKMPHTVRRENVLVQHFLDKLDILMEPGTLSFVKNLQARALGEVQIREALMELRAWERSAEITLLSQEESGRRIPLIKDWKDLFLEMGDKQSLLSSLKESQFFKAFEDQGLALEAKMSTLDFVLHTLNSIQRKWVYLEPIFGRGALPSEEQRFRRVDEDFTDIMNGVCREPKLFFLADAQIFPGLSDKLKVMLDQLERCQKALTDFLEAKRSSMPRFYFIGDDDLLEILGQAKKPEVIQSHLKKLFQGIHKVQFNEGCTQITAMVSSAGEVVELSTPVAVNEKVEDWLELLAQEMRETLAVSLVNCLRNDRFDWGYPAQILCLAQQVKFTTQAEVALRQGSGRDALEDLQSSLNETLRGLTSTDFTGEPLYHLKMKSLVLDIVHQIDVVAQLLKKKCRSLEEWVWKKQLRYYMERDKAVVRMSDATFAYTYEYQGNAPKLVHTPLTDTCYLTLTQGMHMGFGGNPYGPAGTGKTESVKALSACMGRQVLVFNCDEGIDFQSMGRIFIGLVKCGAWGCFDEFNRLKEDQLSAISQQIQVIQDSIKTRTSPIELLGRSINVDFNAGIFVTLNPAGKHYGGRSKLPDNLKALFRPVAMGRPDNELIAEVNLITEGFTQAKDLASKIVSLFKLSKQLLSSQQHYDWNLRALKSVLNSGGRIIQTYKLEGTTVGHDQEYEILIKAIRVNTLPKLTFSDTQKFLALIGDVFPGIESADMQGGELEKAIREVMVAKPFHLVEDASQVKKMIQLKESLDQRMGCVVVGPSGCGKSVLWRILKAAMQKMGQRVVTHVMNPKSMPRERLLGRMDLDTREWFDGVLTDAARQVVKEPAEVRCWIICDGDVDPEWIESLNSVLDDNHLLTLPNGERINFGPNVNFLFETHDLRFASPATVSRMGMIFLSDEDSDVGRLVQRWLSVFPQEQRMSMSSWIDELFQKALDFVLQMESVVETTLMGTVINGLSQIKSATSRQEFITGLIRGLGGNLDTHARVTLAKEVFQWAAERPPDLGVPLDCYGDGGSFVAFQPHISGASGPPGMAVSELGHTAVCPTVSVQRTMAMLGPWIDNCEPFILVGPEGCGKSMVIEHAFRQKRSVGLATINCNAQTTADDVINKISQTCSLFSAPEGRVYRPRDCERLVLYLKDINLPRPDQYDTCQLIAFLQQLVTFDGFYDETLEFLRLERIQIVASMNAATTVGRHMLSTRFTAVIRIGVVDYPETSELVAVYDTFLNTVLNSVPLRDTKFLQPTERERLADTIVEIYQKTREKFTVDDRRHYLFTPRDMTLWVKNLCRYDLEVEDLLDVVAEEANRIFRDRLVGSEAQARFDQMLASIMRSSYRHTIGGTGGSGVPVEPFIYTSLTSARGGGGGSESKGDDSDASIGGRVNRMPQEEFKKLVAQGKIYYEREERDMDLLLFPESLEHIAHVDRTLSSNAGHLLMVGRCGVGRRNAVTIASYMLGYELFSPAVGRDYSASDFSTDIKPIIQNAGIKGEPTVLLVEDFQITTDAILEIVNSLISAGEVPGLYTHEELDPLLTPLKEMAREEGSGISAYDLFVSRVKRNLHIVLLMDPEHPQFLYRCESNPALYAQCTVLWIGEWRAQSLRGIPLLLDGIRDLVTGRDSFDAQRAGKKRGGGGTGRKGAGRREESKGGESKGDDGGDSKFDENDLDNNDYDDDDEGESKGDETVFVDTSDEITELILNMHSCCEGASPRDFMSLLGAWDGIYNAQKHEVLRELGHLTAGLDKLDAATLVVNDLRTNAKQQEVDLTQAQGAADRAMDEISKALGDATERRVEVNDVKKTVAQNEAATKQRKDEIEAELSEVQPILDRFLHTTSQRSNHLVVHFFATNANTPSRTFTSTFTP
jgi:dynein heavy chain 2